MSTNIDKINTIFGDSLMKSIVNLIIYLRVLLIAIKQNKSHIFLTLCITALMIFPLIH